MDVGGVLLLIGGLVVLLVILLVVLVTPLLLIAAIAEPLRRPRPAPAAPRAVRVVDVTEDDDIEARDRAR